MRSKKNWVLLKFNIEILAQQTINRERKKMSIVITKRHWIGVFFDFWRNYEFIRKNIRK